MKQAARVSGGATTNHMSELQIPCKRGLDTSAIFRGSKNKRDAEEYERLLADEAG
jgi:hypothetical protein